MTASGEDSIAILRKRLGRTMQNFRKEAGLDRDTAAEFIEVTGPTLTRKESGKYLFKRTEIEALGREYHIGAGELEELLDLAKKARARKKRGVFPRFVSTEGRGFIEMEQDDATEILVVTNDVVPYYFQTATYMRALWRGNGEALSDEHVDKLCALRQSRQAVVAKDDAPMIRAIIHESALYLPVGGKDVMREQLLHLDASCELPNVEVQIQPTSGGVYPGIDVSFTLVTFDGGAMVRAPGASAQFYRDAPSATTPYRELWDLKRIAAADLPSSRKLILAAAAHFDGGNDR